MYKFITTTPESRPPKRKQVAQACEACRKRKKRCSHLESSDAERARRPSSGKGASPSAMGKSHVGGERFVGDLNPESTLLADGSAVTGGHAEPDSVGVWLSRWGRRQRQTTTTTTTTTTAAHEAGPLARFLRPDVVAECLRTLPGAADFAGLKRIYLADIHSIFPVLDLGVLDEPADTEAARAAQILTQQAICLAAGANPAARGFLTLDGAATTSYGDFAGQLAAAMRAVLSVGVVADRLRTIPVRVLLALYASEGDDDGDDSAATALTARAVSDAYTLGLHLQVPAARSAADAADAAYRERLFCCVWAADRLSAAFHGRPVLMQERDFGRDLAGSVAGQASSGFRLLLATVLQLDGVIDLYRPRPTTAEAELLRTFPSFEALVDGAAAHRLASRLLAALELLYHAVAILACRMRFGQAPQLQQEQQQQLSALAVAAIVDEHAGQLPHIAFVPFAVSLSLRVAYCELRTSRVPLFRRRARQRLQARCRTIRALGHTFRPALFMADLAETLMHEIDKACPPAAQPDRDGPAAETFPSSDIPADNHETTGAPPPTDVDVLDLAFTEAFPGEDLFHCLNSNLDVGLFDSILGGEATQFPDLG